MALLAGIGGALLLVDLDALAILAHLARTSEAPLIARARSPAFDVV